MAKTIKRKKQKRASEKMKIKKGAFLPPCGFKIFGKC